MDISSGEVSQEMLSLDLSFVQYNKQNASNSRAVVGYIHCDIFHKVPIVSAQIMLSLYALFLVSQLHSTYQINDTYK